MHAKAIIFDMDGVLLDSEPYYFKYLNTLFEKLELSVTQDEYNTFVGMSSRKVWSHLEETRDVDLKIETLMRDEEEQINDIFGRACLEPIDGIPDLLNILDSMHIPMNVASSSYKSTIELIIDKLNLNKYFDFLMSGTDVKNGKPHPDIFLESAKQHGIPPENCIVIEDSHNGVAAAKKAGMTCIGFRNPGSGQQDLSDTDLIIEDYKEENVQSILSLL